jgi:hypothetical protein
VPCPFLSLVVCGIVPAFYIIYLAVRALVVGLPKLAREGITAEVDPTEAKDQLSTYMKTARPKRKRPSLSDMVNRPVS